MTLDHAKQVKERHERDLLELDCVQGVGIGEQRGEPAITIYVDRRPPALRGKIPAQIENVPVVVEESGDFKAL